MEYVKAPALFKIRKALCYGRLYGSRRILMRSTSDT